MPRYFQVLVHRGIDAARRIFLESAAMPPFSSGKSKSPALLFAAALLGMALAQAGAAVQINEFMADNPGRPNDPNALLDMDGSSPGWIELYNNGAAAVDLTGWALSDDPAVPGKWVFAAPVAPATVRTTIPANGFKVVFCGGTARNVANVEPHTTFKLDDSGHVLLSQPDGAGGWTVVSRIGTAAAGANPAVPYPPQRTGVSFGFPRDSAAAAPVFFENDTPGAANPAGVADFCADTVFSADRGFYDAPFTVKITCATPGSTIAWTVNGNTPSPTQGTQVPAPDPFSPPAAVISVNGTTIIRARAWKNGLGSSDTDTMTYIFPAQVLSQTGPLASMGLTVNDTHPWGTTGGDVRSPSGPDWEVDPAIVNAATAADRFSTEDLKKMPVVSVVTPWREAFGPNTAAPDYAATPVANRGFYTGSEVGVANEGADRAGSMELINPDADSANPNAVKGFQVDGNVHVFGGTSHLRWKSYKLSMRFKAQQTVTTDVYGDDTAQAQDLFVLDARLNQAWVHPTASQRTMGDYVRDHVMADLQNKMGGTSFHSRPVHLFLNGLYWGLYILHEKPDERFMADYNGGDQDDWDVIKHSGGNSVDGASLYNNVIATAPMDPALALGNTSNATIAPYFNTTALQNFETLLDLVGLGRIAPNPVPVLTGQAAYEAAVAKLDLPQFIDYMLLNFVGGNTDWAHKNLYASYRRSGPLGSTGKWRWHSWDAEHVFKATGDNNTSRNDTYGPTAIHQKLLVNAEYKLAWADAVHRRIFNNGVLSTAGLQSAFSQRFAEIEPWGVRGESARWGDNRNDSTPYTYTGTWTTEKNRILTSICPARGGTGASTVVAQLRTAGLYPATAAPEFRNNATNTVQHGGAVPVGFSLKLQNTVGGASVLYYTMDGTDPRTPWTSAVSATAQTYSVPLTLNTSRTVKARILNGTVWSALNEAFFSVATIPAAAGNLVVSRIHYRPAAPTTAEINAGFDARRYFEFVELMNVSATTVNLSGVTFGTGLDFTFLTGTASVELPAGARLLLVANRVAFESRHGTALPVFGEFQLGSNLDDSGEEISIHKPDGSEIKRFNYNDKSPWPTAPDGDGFSLVLRNPAVNASSAAHADGTNWRASTESAAPGTNPDANARPGADDRILYAAWQPGAIPSGPSTAANQDADNDGVPNFMEFALGSPPTAGAQSGMPVYSTVFIDPDGTGPDPAAEFPAISLTRLAAADQVTWTPEVSQNLGAWRTVGNGLVTVSVLSAPDGMETITWRATTPAAEAGRLYFRVRAVFTP